MDARIDSLFEDRKRLLTEANRARNTGRERQAVALYKRILLEEPRNVEVALRAAPLLALRGERFGAWQLFRMASQELMRERRREACLATLREACRYVPEEFEAWRLRAEVELRMGRDEAAYETLLQGRQCFLDTRSRAQAIALLERARAIEPLDTEVSLDLARLYARTDQNHAALELLRYLASQVGGRELRRVYALQFRTTLSPRTAWGWLRALLGRSRHVVSEEAAQVAAEPVAPERAADPEPEPARAPEREEAGPALYDGMPEPTLPLVETVGFGEAPAANAARRLTH